MAYLDDAEIDHGVIDLSAWWMPGPMARLRFNGGRIRILHRIASNQAERLPRGGDIRRKITWGLFSCLHHGSAVRYWAYLRELRRVGNGYTNILLTDVRDVVFQADPFDRIPMPREGLLLFTENHGMPIRDESATRNWIEVTYGRARTEAILSFPTLCSGTTIGNSASMITYLEAISDELLRHTHSVANFPGIDQGVHNWLYHHQQLPPARLCHTFEGPVATLGTESIESFRFDTSQRLLNRDGLPVPIVHQYDRHPSLERSLEEWLGPA